MPETEDELLINKYLEGDHKALEVLIQKYLKPIYGFVFRYVNNRQEAEDLTQKTFIQMWRHLKKFDKRKKFSTWLFSIAKNSAIDFLRKKRPILFSELQNSRNEQNIDETLIDPAPLPDYLLSQKHTTDQINSAINKLPLNYQIVLTLYYHDQLNFREIAEALEESINTIQSRHRRALVLLKEMLSGVLSMH
jgi:RNA polymerase sigma-70 factor (ECF subfamily)